jgi:hypothetical protein
MSNKHDRFADIAMTQIAGSHPDLEIPQPLPKASIHLPLDDQPVSQFSPMRKLSGAEELTEELKRLRERYRPFLQDHAPDLEVTRRRVLLEHFAWRVEEEEDRRDFGRVLSGEGSWTAVSVPHYGGPLGRAVTYYRSAFLLEVQPSGSEVCYICFKGADYRASVFINGSYVGSHEGFFAPFEFAVTPYLRPGENVLVVKLENDYIFGGSADETSGGVRYEGSKLYAATGPGYDDPQFGWHHCPPGMGLYQELYLEFRGRIHCHDIFVRPLVSEKDSPGAEAWIEVTGTRREPEPIVLELSLYGQNFEETVFEQFRHIPSTSRAVGMGDTFTEQKLRGEGLMEKPVQLLIENGIHLIRIPLSISDARIWSPDTPWLYQLQVRITDEAGELLDSASRQFGLRSFQLDTSISSAGGENLSDSAAAGGNATYGGNSGGVRKGMFYLNGSPIRLRGANTMGHEQQCVMKKDWDQLIDDLLLARICNMNFLRLTQRPVQSEVYDYCDRLGVMNQTDLPLFGVLKRDRFSEAVRQAEEMERLVRSHPSSILISYINEPFPNSGNKPHRHLTRIELQNFFTAADIVVKLNNPDRVIKHVDGDYDPPSESLPDNHCYTLWYNGHGIDFGKLHQGFWMPVRKGWNYACGEFGVEGLEETALMRTYYPAGWLPNTPEDEQRWSPSRIIGAQTGNFHYLFYPTPDSLDGWVKRSQKWQAEGLKLMTEAFRRDPRMISFAVHLFIDAFPAGWMKTIMDCERNPKPAYFAYRDALEPLMVSIRTDRFRFTAGETASLEIWVCNDRASVPDGLELAYQVIADPSPVPLFSGKMDAAVPACSSAFQGFLEFPAPPAERITALMVRAALVDSEGHVVNDCSQEIAIFPPVQTVLSNSGNTILLPEESQSRELPETVWLASTEPAGASTGVMPVDFFNLEHVSIPSDADLILVRAFKEFTVAEQEIMKAVEKGAVLLFQNLPSGDYSAGSLRISVNECGMMPVHTVHPADRFSPLTSEDFRFWYDEVAGRITPLLERTCSAEYRGEQFMPLLTSGNINERGEWGPALAAAEIAAGNGRIVVNQVLLDGRLKTNPPAAYFAARIMACERSCVRPGTRGEEWQHRSEHKKGAQP